MRVHNTSMMDDFPYLYRGKVLDNKDPKNTGRCKIYVPSIHGPLNFNASYLPWARVISVFPVGTQRGSSHVPDVGDIVWVLFEGGSKESPVYIGGTHGTVDRTVELDKVVLYQEETDSVIYDRTNNKFTINLDNNVIEVRRDKQIDIHSENVMNVSATNTINVSSKTINAEAETINARATTVNVIAPNINLNGNVSISGNLSVSGATTLVKPVSCPGYCHHMPK